MLGLAHVWDIDKDLTKTGGLAAGCSLSTVICDFHTGAALSVWVFFVFVIFFFHVSNVAKGYIVVCSIN